MPESVPTPVSPGDAAEPGSHSPWEVLFAFLVLGLTCFGGPIAHIGYFRDEFVVRRRWIGDSAYADLVGLCQFLPGPASSQVAFSLGLFRAGYRGGLAAWIGFTLPSAIALLAFAYASQLLISSGPFGTGILHGLKLVAVAIVAQAVLGMAKSLCPDRERASIAVVSSLVILESTSSTAQIGSIVLGAAAGLWLCRRDSKQLHQVPSAVSRTVGSIAFVLFSALLLGALATPHFVVGPATQLFAAFYRSGALVFGGGHVVLPLLKDAVVTPGWVTDDAFLAGYGAAQAIPGPLFTFASYLGAVANPLPGPAGAGVALVGIFLPGVLILVATLPIWDWIRANASAQAAMRGVNAAVVGLLAAALYDPIWSVSVHGAADFGLVLVGFVLLTAWSAPPLLVVAVSACGGLVLAGAFPTLIPSH